MTDELFELSVIIPAYNEAANLELILPRLKAALEPVEPSYQIMIVDRVQATDETEAICLKNSVSYVNRSPTDSYGDAVRSGIKAVSGKRILVMDADGSHDPAFIKELLSQKEGHDVVIASRYIDGGGSHVSGGSIFMSRMLNLAYAIAFGLRCSDISNSFKLYDAKLLKSLSLECQNFDIIQEILVKMLRRKPDLKIKEVPFHFGERLQGTSKREYIKFIISYLTTLLKLRLSV
jgi:dolichol-phosphate mannosyltransferase